MLENEVALRVYYIRGEDLVREGVKAFKGVGRVCEDDVELFPAEREEIEDVGAHHGDVGKAKAGRFGLDERSVLPRHLHAIDLSCASGGELEGYCPGPAEKVEDLEVGELVLVVQNVEKSFLGKIRRRPRGIPARRLDFFSLEPSPDDSHIISTALK